MTRVLLLGAGGNAANNVARCLAQAGCWTLGADPDPRMLALSDCSETTVILTSAEREEAHRREVRRLVEKHRIDVVHAQPDPEALWLSFNWPQLGAAAAVPSAWTMLLAHDKLTTAAIIGDLAPRSCVAVALETEMLVDALGLPVWLRARKGAGSLAARRCDTAGEVEAWLTAWEGRGGMMASEFLPGRDLSWTGVYDGGFLVASVAKERLSLLGASRGPSSTATVQRIVRRGDVNVVAEDAIRLMSKHAAAWSGPVQLPHGAFMVDLREDAAGRPRVTEINAGRFGTTIDHYAACGANLPALLVDVALDRLPTNNLPGRDCAEVGDYWVRNTDCVPRLVPAEEMVAA